MGVPHQQLFCPRCGTPILGPPDTTCPRGCETSSAGHLPPRTDALTADFPPVPKQVAWEAPNPRDRPPRASTSKSVDLQDLLEREHKAAGWRPASTPNTLSTPEDSGRITGSVAERSRAQVWAVSNECRASVVTTGRFELSHLIPGEYRVFCFRLGHPLPNFASLNPDRDAVVVCPNKDTEIGTIGVE